MYFAQSWYTCLLFIHKTAVMAEGGHWLGVQVMLRVWKHTKCFIGSFCTFVYWCKVFIRISCHLFKESPPYMTMRDIVCMVVPCFCFSVTSRSVCLLKISLIFLFSWMCVYQYFLLEIISNCVCSHVCFWVTWKQGDLLKFVISLSFHNMYMCVYNVCQQKFVQFTFKSW